MRKIDFDLENNIFRKFQTSRYTMSSKINVEGLWRYCKKNDSSFFILCLGCLMNSVNSVPHLRRRIIDNEVIEFEYLEGVSPIMNDDLDFYLEMRVETPQNFSNIFEWHDYVKKLSEDILNGDTEVFTWEMTERDLTNIANFSCIPWVDFEAITSCILDGHQIQPLVSWGKVNENFEMTVSITVSHIFVNGRELGVFFKNTQRAFDEILNEL